MIKQIYGIRSKAPEICHDFTYNLPCTEEIATQIRRRGNEEGRRHSIAKTFGMAAILGIGFLNGMPQAHAEDNGRRPDSVRQIDMKNSAGIVITEGKPVEEVLAIAEMNSYPEGVSYDRYDNESLTLNGFSLQLNLFAHLDIGNNKKEQYLWLQNSLLFVNKGENKWEAMNGVDIFKVGKVIGYEKIPENMKFYSERLKDVREAEEMEKEQITAEAENGVKFVSEPDTNCMVYNGDVKTARFPFKIALDISVKRISSEMVEIDFKDIPVRHDMIDWKDQKTIVSAWYHDKDIKYAAIEFGKENNAAMVTGGAGNGNYFVAQSFDAVFSMYAVNRKSGKLLQLKLGGTTDNSTAEGIVGVKVNQISVNKVEVTSTLATDPIKIRR